MVLLDSAIDSGAWIQAHWAPEKSLLGIPKIVLHDVVLPVVFKIRAIAFAEIVLPSIDYPERLGIPLASNVWKLDFHIVNRCIREIPMAFIEEYLILVDLDGFEFICCPDKHLSENSAYSRDAGLAYLKDCNLPPKIVRTASLAFELPTDFSDLKLGVRFGGLAFVE